MTAHVHSKIFEKSVVVLQNVSPIKFFLLLHIEKKSCFNSFPVYISKLSHTRLFVFYEDMEINTVPVMQTIDKIWRYTFELRKRNIFCAKLQTKVQKPVWKE